MRLPTGTYFQNYRADHAWWRTKFVWFRMGLLLAVFLLLPHVIGGAWLPIVTLIGYMALAAMGVQLLIGYTGQITLGHAAVVAIGAYTCAVTMFVWGVPYPVAFVLGIFAAGLWSVLWGLPAARVKGLYLIVTTMAMQFFTIYIVIGQWIGPVAGRGRAGFIAIDPGMFTIGPWVIFGSIPTYYWTLIVLVLAQVFLANLLRTRVGRAWRAIRDNDIAAEALGVNIFKYKLLSFFIAGCLGGAAGGFWLTTLAGVTPEHFTLTLSLWLVGAILIGGLGSMYGHIFGAAFLVLVIELLRIILMAAIPVWPAAFEYFLYIRYLIYGLAIIGFLIYEPNGLSYRWWQFKNYVHLWPFSY
ncbi:branched-chain amino acid ABC transporter permease [Dehalococcoidia bacterium]|nr:branched-chain amino acid ABC transporter permease [Dehalococcoidia bacterium]